MQIVWLCAIDYEYVENADISAWVCVARVGLFGLIDVDRRYPRCDAGDNLLPIVPGKSYQGDTAA
jgi:hypothetical protein